MAIVSEIPSYFDGLDTETGELRDQFLMTGPDNACDNIELDCASVGTTAGASRTDELTRIVVSFVDEMIFEGNEF